MNGPRIVVRWRHSDRLHVSWTGWHKVACNQRSFLLTPPANDVKWRPQRYWPLGLGPMTRSEVTTVLASAAPDPSTGKRLPGLDAWLRRRQRREVQS